MHRSKQLLRTAAQLPCVNAEVQGYRRSYSGLTPASSLSLRRSLSAQWPRSIVTNSCHLSSFANWLRTSILTDAGTASVESSNFKKASFAWPEPYCRYAVHDSGSSRFFRYDSVRYDSRTVLSPILPSIELLFPTQRSSSRIAST